jgi:uncharacterized membrane protein YhaH (DUF805 family)
MLGYLFGFNARIGRLNYFLSSILLAIVITIMIFAVASTSLRGFAQGASLSQMKGPLIGIVVIFALASFMLNSMRLRDIGWDPVCVIPLWIALTVVDRVIAAKIPAASLGHDHSGTIVGALVNLGLALALMFWPSGSHETWTPNFGATPPRLPDAPLPRQDGASVAASRVARVAGGGFGRRGG